MPNKFEAAIKQKLMSENMAGKAYKKTNKKKEFIVIHNMVGTSAGSLSYWNNGADGAYTSAHYCVDDKEIWQVLKDKWIAHHCGSATGPAGRRGCNNETSIGIEVADMECDQRKAVELAIELTRYLVEKHNIPYDNVVGHREVSNTECPKWICDNNLLEYIKSEVKRRNDEKIELIFDPSQLQTGDSVSDNNVGTGSMPNFDNREDLINQTEHEIKVLEGYLPEQMSEEDIEFEVARIINEVDAQSIKDLGIVMRAAKQELGNSVDGKLLSEIVKRKLGTL